MTKDGELNMSATSHVHCHYLAISLIHELDNMHRIIIFK